jgi:hypothetical protein
MKNNAFPIYVQHDAIESFINQLTEEKVVSKKTSILTGKSNKNTTSSNLSASFLKIFGFGTKFGQDTNEKLDETEESTAEIASEQKVLKIQSALKEENSLFDLNSSIRNSKQFGSFVVFEAIVKFQRIYRIVEAKGYVESKKIHVICSPKYFPSKSQLIQMIKSNHQISIQGFGVITNIDLNENIVSIKPLTLSIIPKTYKFRNKLP